VRRGQLGQRIYGRCDLAASAMVGNLTTHTACWHRKPKCVVTISDEFAIRKDQNLPTLCGLERTQTPLLLPVAGEVTWRTWNASGQIPIGPQSCARMR